MYLVRSSCSAGITNSNWVFLLLHVSYFSVWNGSVCPCLMEIQQIYNYNYYIYYYVHCKFITFYVKKLSWDFTGRKMEDKCIAYTLVFRDEHFCVIWKNSLFHIRLTMGRFGSQRTFTKRESSETNHFLYLVGFVRISVIFTFTSVNEVMEITLLRVTAKVYMRKCNRRWIG